MRATSIAVLALLALGCGAEAPRGVAPFGSGPLFRPAPGAAGPGCGDHEAAALAHLELFARGKVVIVPAGIGVREPLIDGAYVRGGRCRHVLHTTEPTGLIAVGRPGLTLGDLFAIWGQPLSGDRLLSHELPVRVHVDGRRWPGDPNDVPLTHHAQIVVQAGSPPVEPHASYLFPE